MLKRVWVLAAAALVVLAATVGGATARPAADPGITSNSILLGGTFPLSGSASLYGAIPVAEKAYFDYVNDTRGGVNGRKITFKYVDDGYDASQTVPATRQLVEQDKVFAIVNSLGTAPGLSVRDYLNQRKVPQVLLATGDSFWGFQYKKYPWTIGYNPSYPGEGTIFAKYILSKTPQAKVGVLVQNDPFGGQLLAGLRRGFAPNSKSRIVDVEPVDVTAPDVTQQMIKLKASGADTLVIFATPSPSIKGFVTAFKLGWHPQIYVTNVSSSPLFMGAIAKAAGNPAAVDGAVTTAYVKDATDPSQASDPGVKLFQQIMAKYYPKGTMADSNLIYAMSVGWTAVNALQRAGKNPTRASFMQALTTTNTAANPFLLKGVTLQTSATDHFFVEDLTMARWGSSHWSQFGPFYHHAR
jgi:branched-chain amino acid transport system substrate-binding protein